jgi:hypothetical protein
MLHLVDADLKQAFARRDHTAVRHYEQEAGRLRDRYAALQQEMRAGQAVG